MSRRSFAALVAAERALPVSAAAVRALDDATIASLAAARQQLLDAALDVLRADTDVWDARALDRRVWGIAVHPFVEELRRRIGARTDDDDNARMHTLREVLHAGRECFAEAVRLLAAVDNPRDARPAPLARCLVCLGDLHRYSAAYSVASPDDDRALAAACYALAVRVMPLAGQPFNQLATLAVADGRTFDAAYGYVRSLAATQPFDSRDALTALLARHAASAVVPSPSALAAAARGRRRVRQATAVASGLPAEQTLLSLLACLFARVGMDTLGWLLTESQRALVVLLEDRFDAAVRTLLMLLHAVSHLVQRDNTTLVLAADALVLLHEVLLHELPSRDGVVVHLLVRWLAANAATLQQIAPHTPSQQLLHRQAWTRLAAFASGLQDDGSDTGDVTALPEFALLQGVAALRLPATASVSERVLADVRRLHGTAMAFERDVGGGDLRRRLVLAMLRDLAATETSPLRWGAGFTVELPLETSIERELRLEDDKVDAQPVAIVQLPQADGDDSDEMRMLKLRSESLQQQLGRGAAAVVRPVAVERRVWHVVPHRTHVVLDTNLLVGTLDVAQQVLALEMFVLVVPLIVMAELRGLACGSAVQDNAENAMSWIEGLFAARSRYIRYQTSRGSLLDTLANRNKATGGGAGGNDDLILAGCRALEQTLASGDSPGDVALVALVTDDANLRVKALAASVCVYNGRFFLDLARKLARRQ